MAERMIVRSRIVPIISKQDGQRVVYVEQVDEEKILDATQKLIENLNLRKSEFGEVENWKRLNDFLDYFIFSIRSSLYIDPEPNVLKSLPKKLHKAYLYSDIRNAKEYIDQLYSKDDEQDISMDLLLEIPGDKRPGFNCTSYMTLSQTVSAIACAKYLNNKKRGDDSIERNLATLRLASLLLPLLTMNHRAGDLLKTAAPKADARLGELINQILDRKIDSELLKIYEDAFKFAVGGNTPAFVLQFAGGSYGTKYADIFNKANDGFFDIKKWDNVPESEVESLSESFAKGAARLKNNPIFEGSSGSSDKDVVVVRFDVRSIQTEIRVNDIRTMIFGSFIVDYCVFVQIPLSLTDEGLPAECILYYGGGNTTVVMPSSLNGMSWEQIAMHAASDSEKLSLSVSFGHSLLVDNFAEMNSAIDAELTQKKLSPSKLERELTSILNLHLNCQICGKRRASDSVGSQNDRKYVCSVCKDRYDQASEFYFMQRLDKMKFDALQIAAILPHVFEFIAGNEPGSKGQMKNVAVIRFDANVIGTFMGSSVSLADAFERSILIDRAIKKAYRSFISMIRESTGNSKHKDVERILLGTMYIGGDDATIFLPSKLALFMAVYMINEFFNSMGGIITLSAGIVAAKPRHPFVQLYESAGYLLDEISKKNTRERAYRIRELGPSTSGYRGAVSFFVADGGYVDEEILESYLSSVHEKRISRQYKSPYHVIEESNRESILNIMRILSGPLAHMDYKLSNLEECIKEDIVCMYRNEQYSKALKSNVVSPAKSVASASVSGDRSNAVKLIFALRQSARLEDISAETYRRLVEAVYVTDGSSDIMSFIFPIDDVLQAVKLVIGE